MTVLDGDIGDVIRCDRCGKVHDFENSDFRIYHELWRYVIFKGRPFPNPGGDFCKECAVEITPLVWKLRDVDELRFSVNKLERAIREKRKQGTQDNRPTAGNACKCC